MKKRIGDFTVNEVMPGIYAISGEAVMRYLLAGSHHALLFDTGYGFADLKACVREITDLPLYVVNSHGHVDHTGANIQFEEPVYIHASDEPVYQKHQSAECRKEILKTVKLVKTLCFFARIFPRKLSEKAYLASPMTEKFSYICEGDRFDLGGLTAEVYEIPGHTPGSVGLLCRERRVFFASDGMNDATYLFLPESCPREIYLAFLEKVKTLDFDFFFTGHVSTCFPKSRMESYIAVARDPDFEHGKKRKETGLAPGVEARRCRQRNHPKNPAVIEISREKL